MKNANGKSDDKINVDLAKERSKCAFNTLELTNVLDGGCDETQKRRELENFFFNDVELMSGTPRYFLNHKEKYEDLARKMYHYAKRIKQDGTKTMYDYAPLSATLESGFFGESCPMDTHFYMFTHSIETQGTEEQKEKWLPRAKNCKILGTYAQTELGHGTFVRGLETTATYDAATQEFILNSPTLTSYKWWPAGLGNTCNYAVVLAQLYSLGKCHGLHAFIVQLRDEDTHRPLPNIKIGDIGPKLGMSGADNGFICFKNARIPKDNMLMGNSKILPDGTYIESINQHLIYGTMLRVRVSLVDMSADFIKMAVTIAVRYSAVRRQSQLKSGETEVQIIDYLTQQYKLFPLIAAAFAYHYTSFWLKNLFKDVTLQLQNRNLKQLPELHAVTSCLKAITTADAASAVEACRLACGGHGFMMCSGFPKIYGISTPMCTYEGENTVLLLQTARSLMKAWSRVLEGKPLSPTMEYLRVAKGDNAMPFSTSIDWIVWAMEKISVRKIERAWNHMESAIRKGTSPEDAWNLTSIELVAAAEAFARAFVVKNYRDMTSSAMKAASQPLQVVLLQLLNLYGVYVVLNVRGDLLTFTDTDASVMEALQQWLVTLLRDIRPNAVGIVDSFDIRDEALSSALGAYDGNVYERIFAESQKSPLNTGAVNESFELYLKPLMQSKF